MNDKIVLEEIERQLSRKYEEPVKISRSVPVGGGCIHHALRLETNIGDFFLKWNNSGPADIFLREAEGLAELSLAGSGSLIIPEVILSSEISKTPGFLLMEYLEPARGNMHDEISLGKGLAEIHRFKGRYFGFHHDNHCGLTLQKNTWKDGWIDFFGNNRILFLLNLLAKKGSFNRPEAAVIEKLVARLPEILPDGSEPSLIHGDLWSGNYMVTARGPALIDPAACYADREMEFGILILFGGFSENFWQGYQEAYPLPPDWKERNPVYQLYHLLNHYYLFGGGYGTQAMRIARYFAG